MTRPHDWIPTSWTGAADVCKRLAAPSKAWLLLIRMAWVFCGFVQLLASCWVLLVGAWFPRSPVVLQDCHSLCTTGAP